MQKHGQSVLEWYFKDLRYSIMLFYLLVCIYRTMKRLFSTSPRQSFSAIKWHIIGIQDRVKCWSNVGINDNNDDENYNYDNNENNNSNQFNDDNDDDNDKNYDNDNNDQTITIFQTIHL